MAADVAALLACGRPGLLCALSHIRRVLLAAAAAETPEGKAPSPGKGRGGRKQTGKKARLSCVCANARDLPGVCAFTTPITTMRLVTTMRFVLAQALKLVERKCFFFLCWVNELDTSMVDDMRCVLCCPTVSLCTHGL